jgi:hypothetical protein
MTCCFAAGVLWMGQGCLPQCGCRDQERQDRRTGTHSGTAAKTIDVHGMAVAPDSSTITRTWMPSFGTLRHLRTAAWNYLYHRGQLRVGAAPVKIGDEDALVQSFVRVEAIPRFCPGEGVPWGWHSYRDYLDRLEGRLGSIWVDWWVILPCASTFWARNRRTPGERA